MVGTTAVAYQAQITRTIIIYPRMHHLPNAKNVDGLFSLCEASDFSLLVLYNKNKIQNNTVVFFKRNNLFAVKNRHVR